MSAARKGGHEVKEITDVSAGPEMATCMELVTLSLSENNSG